MRSLSQEEIDIYREKGALVVRNAISTKLIEKLLRTLEEQYILATSISGGFEDIVKYLNKNDPDKLYKIHTSTSKRELFSYIEEELSGILLQLLDSNSYELVANQASYLFGLPRDKRLVYNWHQECNYMKSVRPIITAQYPINVGTSPKNGAMSYLSNSSSLGELEYEKQFKENPNGYTSLVPANIEKIKKEFKEEQPSLSLGDCLFFDEYCIHKSNFNTTNNLRTTGIFRVTSQKYAKNFIPFKGDEL